MTAARVAAAVGEVDDRRPASHSVLGDRGDEVVEDVLSMPEQPEDVSLGREDPREVTADRRPRHLR